MAERPLRSATRRMTPQSPRNNVTQSPLHRTVRSTRSRSIDSENSKVGLKRGQKMAREGMRTGATIDYDDLQHALQGKGRAQSRPWQDLATLVEDPSVPDPELTQNEFDKANQSAGRGKALPKPGAKSPGATSAFSGNTARISGSAPSWTNSDSAEEVSQVISEKIIKTEPAIQLAISANGAQIKPVFQRPAEPLRSTLQQMDVPTPKSAGLGHSNTRFNSPKTIQGTAAYLKQTKANRKASESAWNVSVASTENTSLLPPIAPAKMQMNLTAEAAETIFERAQVHTNANREYGFQPHIDSQNRGFEDNIARSRERKEGLYPHARRVQETKEQLEADSNKENLAEPPGRSRQAQRQTYRSRSAQGGKKKHFIDPQPNAERLRFDDSQDSHQHTQLSRKAQHDDLEAVVDNGDNRVDAIEYSSDEGFQQDRRAIIAVSKSARTRSGNPVVREPVVRPRLSPKEVRSAPQHGDVEDEPRGAVTQRDQRKIPEQSQFESYKKANEMAKRNVAVLPKKVQARNPWTNEETETLIGLIGEHGISWKLLKECDNASRLKNRDQVALKDKARNMKFDYLKAGPFLPQNFENVPLNKMQTDKLRSLGIVYDPATGQRDDGELEATEDQ